VSEPELIAALVQALECPRPLSTQVLQHLEDAHGVPRGEAAAFLTGRLSDLEDFEVERILSPLFTPSLEDQAAVAPILRTRALPESDWPELVAQLLARPVRARLVAEDGTPVSLPLPAVILQRHIGRLRLQGSIPAELADRIDRHAQADRPLLLAVARRAIWGTPARRAILQRFLEGPPGPAVATDARGLLRLMESYEPADLAEWLVRAPAWHQGLRQAASRAGAPGPFFNARVEDLHGGERDQRSPATGRAAAVAAELELLERLQRILAS
jgi:hypothetical protein